MAMTREQQRDWLRRYRNLLAKQGRCIYNCGSKPAPGRRSCNGCTRYRKELAKAKRKEQELCAKEN